MKKNLKLQRRITYCPRVNRTVNHDISYIHSNGQSEIIATCTGIEDKCYDCFILETYK